MDNQFHVANSPYVAGRAGLKTFRNTVLYFTLFRVHSLTYNILLCIVSNAKTKGKRTVATLLDALLLNDRKQPNKRIPMQLIVRDAVDRKRYYVQHSVMRATKTTQQTMHFLSGPRLSNVNVAMHESFRKSLLECVVLTVRLFCRHCLQHPSR